MFVSPDEQERLEAAVRAAEKETSGEIVVCLRKQEKGDIRAAAETFFTYHGLDQTAERNGVLIYLAWADRKLAVIGDTGIHEKVPPDFWEKVVGAMTELFKKGDNIGGLEAGIHEIGHQLRQWFPHQEDDVNELPDGIQMDDGEAEGER